MLGDFILWIKNAFKQFKCTHKYKPDRIGMITGLYFGELCIKCGRRKR